MENSESYTETFNRLNNQLDGIEVPVMASPGEALSASPRVQTSSPGHVITFKPIYLYGGIPIGVLLIFIMTQPVFLKDETVDEKGEKTRKINLKKVLIWTAVIAAIIDVGIFAYFHQQKNKKAAV